MPEAMKRADEAGDGESTRTMRAFTQWDASYKQMLTDMGSLRALTQGRSGDGGWTSVSAQMVQELAELTRTQQEATSNLMDSLEEVSRSSQMRGMYNLVDQISFVCVCVFWTLSF